MKLRTLTIVMLLLMASTGLVTADDKGLAAFEKVMANLFPGQQPDAVAETPVDGLYEVVMGPRVLYLSADGRYLINGSIIDLSEKKNITEPRKALARVSAIDGIGEDKMIVFSPKQFDHTVTVFTDIDCGYCRKLHREIADYNENGIRVRYLMYPRAGIDSESYNKAVSVWCSGDRAESLTIAKQGGRVDSGTCENPVTEHMLMGELLGINGTPAIVSDRGEMMPGYVPAERLRKHLDTARSGG